MWTQNLGQIWQNFDQIYPTPFGAWIQLKMTIFWGQNGRLTQFRRQTGSGQNWCAFYALLCSKERRSTVGLVPDSKSSKYGYLDRPYGITAGRTAKMAILWLILRSKWVGPSSPRQFWAKVRFKSVLLAQNCRGKAGPIPKGHFLKAKMVILVTLRREVWRKGQNGYFRRFSDIFDIYRKIFEKA